MKIPEDIKGFAVCLGFDAMRAFMGLPLHTFTIPQIIDALKLIEEENRNPS